MKDFLTIIGAFLLLLALYILLFYALVPKICKIGAIVSKLYVKIEGCYSRHIEYEKAMKAGLGNGTVYKKEILSDAINCFAYIPMRYRIHIKNDVNVNGRVISKTAFFDVMEGTFSMYSVGDWFDIENIKINNSELLMR